MTDIFFNDRLKHPSDGADDETLRDYGRQLAMDSLIRDAYYSRTESTANLSNIATIAPAGKGRNLPIWGALAACLAGAVGLAIWHFSPGPSNGLVGKNHKSEIDGGTGTTLKLFTIKLPKARYIGTPKPISDPSLPHLEKLQEKERLTELKMRVPSGTRLLSQGKPVTATEQPIDGDLEMITDGDMAAEQYCDIGIGPQSVTIDLGAEHNISAVVVWHFHESARAFHDVVVELGTDADFVNKPVVIYNSDHDGSLGKGHGPGTEKAYVETNEGRVITANGTTGRYVRLWTSGSSSDENNYYTEVQVYGK